MAETIRKTYGRRWLCTWMIPALAAWGISAIWHLRELQWLAVYVSLIILAHWLWQLGEDIHDTYKHALMHADAGAAASMPSMETRYVTLRCKRGFSPGIWAVVVYDGDSIRMYQGLGKIPLPPGRAEKTWFARQVA